MLKSSPPSPMRPPPPHRYSSYQGELAGGSLKLPNSTDLLRPSSSDHRHSLGPSPRHRPRSQIYRSSPLAGPVVSYSSLSELDNSGKGKESNVSDTSRPKPAQRSASTSALKSDSLGTSWADNDNSNPTYRASRSASRRRPAAVTDVSQVENRRSSSIESSSHSAASFPSSSSGPSSSPLSPHSAKSSCTTLSSQASTGSLEKHNWLAAEQTPIFSRSSMYVQGVVMPIPASKRKSIVIVANANPGTSSNINGSRSRSNSVATQGDGGAERGEKACAATDGRRSKDAEKATSGLSGVKEAPAVAEADTRTEGVGDGAAEKSGTGKRLKRGLSLSISHFRLPRRRSSSPPPPMPNCALAPTVKDDTSSSSAISDPSTPNCTPIIYDCSEDCAYATPRSKVPMKPNEELGSSSARGLRSSKSIGRAWKSLRRWRSLGDKDSRSSKERNCEAAGIPPVPPLPSLPASALIADHVATAGDTYSLGTFSCEGTKEVLVISTPSPTTGSPDSKDASGMQETQGQGERLTFPKVLPVRRVMASLVLRPRSSGRSK